MNPVTLTVTAANNNMPGGGPLPSPLSTPIYSGFVNGDTAGTALNGAPGFTTTATTNTTNTPINSFQTITPNIGTLVAVNGNYTFTFVNGIMTVGTPLTITVTPLVADQLAPMAWRIPPGRWPT